MAFASTGLVRPQQWQAAPAHRQGVNLGTHEHDGEGPKAVRAPERSQMPALWALLVVLVAGGLVVVLRVFLVGPSYSSVCVYPRESVAVLGQVEALTGHEYSCVMAYDNADPTWATWEAPWFATTGVTDQNWSNWVRQSPSRRLVITLSLVPSDAPADWREACASGGYDGYARALAHNLVRDGFSHSVLRISPEANDPASGIGWVGGSAAEISAWAECWADEAKAMDVPGSHFVFDWTVNAGYEDIAFTEYYPGNAAVDVIGVDAYDTIASGRSVHAGRERWKLLSHEPAGLADLVAFAKRAGKPLSVPEWGEVAPPAGAGDDPYYMEHMAKLFKRDHVLYESYFDEDDSGTLRLGEVPKSLREYQAMVLRA